MEYYCKKCEEDLSEWIILNNMNPEREPVRCPNCGHVNTFENDEF